MDMAIGEDVAGGDSLGPLDRVKLSSVDIEGRPALRPRGAFLVSMIVGNLYKRLDRVGGYGWSPCAS